MSLSTRAISHSSILSQPNFSITFSWSTLPETTHGVTACTSSDDDDSGLCLSKLSISHPTNKRLIYEHRRTNFSEKQKKDINEEEEREGQIFCFFVLTNNKEAHMGFLLILKVLYLEPVLLIYLIFDLFFLFFFRTCGQSHRWSGLRPSPSVGCRMFK